MAPSPSVGSLHQGRRNLCAVLEILDGLWLDNTPDIEEDLLVPARGNHREIHSRALAARVKGQVLALLAQLSDQEAASSDWVARNQDEVRRELKRYENVYQKGRSLYDLYAANHAQLSARFNIRFDEQLSALEITRRIYRALHNEVLTSATNVWSDGRRRACNSRRRASPGPARDREVDVSDNEEHIDHSLGAHQSSTEARRQLALDRAEQAGGVFWPRSRGD